MARIEDAGGRKDRLTVAELRRARLIKLFGGKSTGQVCDYCRIVIHPNEPEYEVDAELDGTKLALHFHVACYDTWRAASGADEPLSSPGAHDSAA